MVNEEAPTDSGARVNFNSGDKTVEVRQTARHQAEFMLPEEMSQTVKPQRMQSGVAEKHFQSAPRRWVFGEDGLNIFFQSFEHE
jgi:hypothetical protein